MNGGVQIIYGGIMPKAAPIWYNRPPVLECKCDATNLAKRHKCPCFSPFLKHFFAFSLITFNFSIFHLFFSIQICHTLFHWKISDDFCDIWICNFQENGDFEKILFKLWNWFETPWNFPLKIWDPLCFCPKIWDPLKHSGRVFPINNVHPLM